MRGHHRQRRLDVRSCDNCHGCLEAGAWCEHGANTCKGKADAIAHETDRAIFLPGKCALLSVVFLRPHEDLIERLPASVQVESREGLARL